MDGFLLINKPEGYTSRDICNVIGKKFSEKKVGHVGTLDPFATGLLIVMLGKATKCLQFFDDFSKTYIATISLGNKTDSMDKTGKNIETKQVPELSKEFIEETLFSFLGKQKQIPPMTSAVHVNGTKLYKLAHQGVEIERPSRDIEVFSVELLDFSSDQITFKAHVSKGTYIRVLGNDIAEKLGTVGHLSRLIRADIGPFSIDESIDLDDAKNSDVKSIFEILSRFSKVKKIDEKKAKEIMDGKIKYYEFDAENDKLLITDNNDNPIAMYTKNIEGKYEFTRGLF